MANFLQNFLLRLSGNSWKGSQQYQDVQGKSGITRFFGWLNQHLNPNHNWFDYDKVDSTVGSVVNQVTQDHMTGADVEANEMSMQNAEDIYQRQVTGMQKAGLNPALMYQNSAAGSTPQAQNSSQGVSMSELMQVMLLPLQKKMMEAQISNVDAKTDRERAETDFTRARTENMNLVNKYYPQVTETGLEETLSRIGVNVATIDQKDADTALTNVKKLIADKENKYADEFFKARKELEEAKTEEARQSAAAHAANALMTGLEAGYAEKNGAKMSSSSILALVSAIGNFTGLDDPAVQKGIKDVVGNIVEDSTQPFGLARRVVRESKDYFKRWRNRGGSR